MKWISLSANNLCENTPLIARTCYCFEIHKLYHWLLTAKKIKSTNYPHPPLPYQSLLYHFLPQCFLFTFHFQLLLPLFIQLCLSLLFSFQLCSLFPFFFFSFLFFPFFSFLRHLISEILPSPFQFQSSLFKILFPLIFKCNWDRKQDFIKTISHLTKTALWWSRGGGGYSHIVWVGACLWVCESPTLY